MTVNPQPTDNSAEAELGRRFLRLFRELQAAEQRNPASQELYRFVFVKALYAELIAQIGILAVEMMDGRRPVPAMNAELDAAEKQFRTAIGDIAASITTGPAA